jgi:hypothetical protein
VRRRLEYDEASPAELRQLLRAIVERHQKGKDLGDLLVRARELAAPAPERERNESEEG